MTKKGLIRDSNAGPPAHQATSKAGGKNPKQESSVKDKGVSLVSRNNERK
jgi:hypothetical protein